MLTSKIRVILILDISPVVLLYRGPISLLSFCGITLIFSGKILANQFPDKILSIITTPTEENFVFFRDFSLLHTMYDMETYWSTDIEAFNFLFNHSVIKITNIEIDMQLNLRATITLSSTPLSFTQTEKIQLGYGYNSQGSGAVVQRYGKLYISSNNLKEVHLSFDITTSFGNEGRITPIYLSYKIIGIGLL